MNWVVLAAYNEEKGLPPLLDSTFRLFEEENKPVSVIVVDDGSSDRTKEILEDYAKKSKLIPVIHPKNKGLAEALKSGLLTALQKANKDDIIVTMDADNTHPAGLALRMVRLVREGSDVVIASRYQPGAHVLGLSLFRRLLSRVASILFRVTFPIRGVKDYTSGYRAYRVDALQRLTDKYHDEFISERGFSCMVDILLKLREERVVCVEVPMILRYDQKDGQSKMKVFQTILDTLKLLLRRRLGLTKANPTELSRTPN